MALWLVHTPGLRNPGLIPGCGYFVEFLDKRHYSLSASLHPSEEMDTGTSNFNVDRNPAMD